MNLGLDDQPQPETTIQQKRRLFSVATDPAREGDHRMEQFQLLSSLELTSYAKKVFLDYFSKIEQKRSTTQKNWKLILVQLEDAVYSRLQKRRQESSYPTKPINAEVMMSVLDELGDPSTFLYSEPAPVTEKTPLRRLYRSEQERMVGGVCGGIAEYFRIDPVFVRVLFVAFTFLGGWSIPVYLLLFFILPTRSKLQPIFDVNDPKGSIESIKEELETEKLKEKMASLREDVDSTSQSLREAVDSIKSQLKSDKNEEVSAPKQQAAPPKKKKSGFFLFRMIRGLFLFIFVSILFWGLYIPILGALGGLSLASAAFIFYPIFENEPGFFFHAMSLEQLGVPGIVAGSSMSLLFFSVFMLILAFVFKLHFKKVLLGKNFQAIFVVFVVMSLFTTIGSAGVIFSQNKEVAKVSMSKTFSLPKDGQTLHLNKTYFAGLKKNPIPLKKLSVVTDKAAKKMSVKITLFARGKTTGRARKQLKYVQVNWSDKPTAYFPSMYKTEGSFHFEYANVALIVPKGISVDLEGIPVETSLQGEFGESIVIHNNKKVSLEKVKATLIRLQNNQASVRLSDVHAKRALIHNRYGHIEGSLTSDKFELRNLYGHATLELNGLSAKRHLLHNLHGFVDLSLPVQNLPKIDAIRMHSAINDGELDFLKTSTTTWLMLDTEGGAIKLRSWNPLLSRSVSMPENRAVAKKNIEKVVDTTQKKATMPEVGTPQQAPKKVVAKPTPKSVQPVTTKPAMKVEEKPAVKVVPKPKTKSDTKTPSSRPVKRLPVLNLPLIPTSRPATR